MATILANDGIDERGRILLENAGHLVITDKVAQSELASQIKDRSISAVLVRSATQITRSELCAWKGLKVIGRAGVGLDNIDQVAAKELGIAVVNTPAASSQSVAELALAHMFTLARQLQRSNREMPQSGATDFAKLKKAFADGWELQGKTLGIIGFGRIGQALAKMAIGLGMKVKMHDPFVQRCEFQLELVGIEPVKWSIESSSFESVLAQSDIISFHVPKPKNGPLIGAEQLKIMQEGVVLINASRGGVIDEPALLAALASGRVGGAGLDVFENEPSPMPQLLNHPRISVTPHIGASTSEAQERIGVELAEKVIAVLG
jgi:D-3-phosphoglycerate dehydrogenase